MPLQDIATALDDGSIGVITLAVASAPKEPSYNAVTRYTSSGRAHRKERDRLLLAACNIAFEAATRPHRGDMSLPEALSRLETMETYTLAVFVREFSDVDRADNLLGFLHDHKYGYQEKTMREIATYRRYAPDVHHQMLSLLIDELRKSRPAFAREDLSELRWRDRDEFNIALEFILHLYRQTTESAWKEDEFGDWRRTGLKEEALFRVPKISPEILDEVISHPEQMDALAKKVIGWHPVAVLNNTKSIAGNLLGASLRMMRGK